MMIRGAIFTIGILAALGGTGLFLLNAYAIGMSTTGVASDGDKRVSHVALGIACAGLVVIAIAWKIIP